MVDNEDFELFLTDFDILTDQKPRDTFQTAINDQLEISNVSYNIGEEVIIENKLIQDNTLDTDESQSKIFIKKKKKKCFL